MKMDLRQIAHWKKKRGKVKSKRARANMKAKLRKIIILNDNGWKNKMSLIVRLQQPPPLLHQHLTISLYFISF